MSRRVFHIIASLLILSLTAQAADKVSVRVSPPQEAVVGEPFRIQLIVSDKASDPQWTFPSGLEVLYGPAVSRSSSTRIINGKMSRSSSTSFTYTLIADHAGSYSLPSATVKVGGATYRSGATTFEVYEPSAASPGASGSGASGDESEGQISDAEAVRLSNDALQVVANVSKTTVYEQEALLVTYKLYSRYQGIQIESANFPEYDGFVKQEIPQSGPLQLDIEQYRGKNYYTVTLLRQLLFPQKPGKLSVPSGSFGLLVTVPSQNNDPDDFFSGFFDSYQRVRKKVTTKPFTVNVKPLPTPKPDDFTGAVGNFRLTTDGLHQPMKTGESVQLKLTLSGEGNLKLSTLPEVEWPEGFEVYDPQEEDDIQVTAGGASGWKSIEYFAIPRYEGTYTIPEITYSYFDPNTGSYRREVIPAQRIQVEKGNGSAVSDGSAFGSRDAMKRLGNDIRYLKPTGSLTHLSRVSLRTYWLLYGVVFLIGLVAFFLIRARRASAVENSHNRARRAGKMARKYLKLAEMERAKGDNKAYYEALLNGLNSYLCAKLHIPPSDLSKERIAEIMRANGLSEELVGRTLSVQLDLELARFAPSEEGGLRDELYKTSSEVIDGIEASKIKIKE